MAVFLVFIRVVAPRSVGAKPASNPNTEGATPRLLEIPNSRYVCLWPLTVCYLILASETLV